VAITTSPATRTVTLPIDGREVTAPEDATIWEAAKEAGIEIPVLCQDVRYDPGEVALGPVLSMLARSAG
jgi:predicted molibdopterin-dependent oxidoreductase YjgC